MHNHSSKQSEIVFVLVRPSFLGNIGSVARVLKNFGYESFRLVAPPKNYKDAEARKMAVGAFDVLKNSPVYATLSDALKDINVAIGTTCGKQRSLSPEGLAALSAELNAHGNNRIAIVFGEERDGLLQKELELCHHIMRIATSSEFPSLNVAQAVGIVAYEISRQRDAAAAKAEDCAKRAEADLAKVDEYESNAEPEFAKAEQYASGAEADELFSRLEVLLHEVGFTRSFNKNSVIAEFRALYMRAKPSQREMRLLEGALRKIEQKIGP